MSALKHVKRHGVTWGLAGSMIVCAIGLAASPAAGALVLLNDTFADGERVTQNLPDSAQWFNRRGSAELTVLEVNGNNKLHTSSNTTGFWAHFAPSGSPVTLDVGEWIELSARVSGDIAFTGDRNLGLGWGLFDSKGTRDTEDGSGTGGARTDDTGYLVWTNPNRLQENTSRVDRALITSDHFQTHTLLQQFPSIIWGDQPQNVTLLITRTGASEMTLEASIGGVAMSGAVVDTAATAFSFDTVSFFFDNRVYSPTGGRMVVDDVVVTVIPEPTVAGLLGLGTLLMLRRGRGAM